ncbi:hypothetical protein [Thermohalobacter berrensis]|uniref:Alpha-glucosidase n=1 Tax=Thermohalobacter berrensis TaxID=99594 RepID=A0A419T7E3_9FIRM|nr:hypothetical protein [Thermohalobacter berrensis]RKD33507.1 hypothetical protein BET03_08965 [Thermohalobacter berrensis]
MNTEELIEILDKLDDKINKTKLITPKRKEKYLKNISSIKEEYKRIEIPKEKDFEKVYKSLVNKGNELTREFRVNADSKELNGKIQYYLRYLKAAKGDFVGETDYLGKYFRVYVFTSVLFLALSPQYYGFILPAIFFVPIFLGVRGIRNRSRTGFQLSLAVIPVAIMTSSTWIRYGLYALSNFEEALANTIQASGLSPTIARLLVVGPPILAVVLFALAILQGYRAYKTKDLFV